MELSVAKKLVVDICYQLQPFCDRINIAGSIRRAKPEVKDLEIVCLPKQVEIGQVDMFGSGEKEFGVVEGFRNIVMGLGSVVKGLPSGKYMQIALPEGVNLDLFMPEGFDYYRQYAIRTGSADYAAKRIAYGWKKIGWCGSDKGLRKISDCLEVKTPDGKSKWKCFNVDAEKPPVWESEKDFFSWLGIEMIPPQKRII